MIKIKSWLCILMCLNVASLAPKKANPMSPKGPEDASERVEEHVENWAALIANIGGEELKVDYKNATSEEQKKVEKIFKEAIGNSEKVGDENKERQMWHKSKDVEKIAKEISDAVFKQYHVSPEKIIMIINACMANMTWAMKNKNAHERRASFDVMKNIIEQALKINNPEDIIDRALEINLECITFLNRYLTESYYDALEDFLKAAQRFDPAKPELILMARIKRNEEKIVELNKTIEELNETDAAYKKLRETMQELIHDNVMYHIHIAQLVEFKQLQETDAKVAELGVKLEGMQSLNVSLMQRLKNNDIRLAEIGKIRADELTKAIARIEELKENLKEAKDRDQGNSEAFEEYKTASVKTANELREQCKMLSKQSELLQTQIATLSGLNGILETGNQELEAKIKELEATELSKIACAALVDVDRLKNDLIKANEAKTAAEKAAEEQRTENEKYLKSKEDEIEKLKQLIAGYEKKNRELNEENKEVKKVRDALFVTLAEANEERAKANEAKTAAEKAAEEQRTENEKYLKSKEDEIEKLKQLIAGHNDEKRDQDLKIKEITKARDELFAKFTEANSKEKTSKLESLKSLNGTNSMQGQYNQLSRVYDVLLEEHKKLKAGRGILASQKTDEQVQQRRAAEISRLVGELKKTKGQLKASQQLLDQALDSQTTSSSSSSGAMPSTGSGPTPEEVQLAANNLQFNKQIFSS